MSSELSSVESGHMPLLLFVLRVLLRLWKLLADERLSGAEQRFSVTDPTSANSRAKRTLTSCSAVFDARLSLPFSFDETIGIIPGKVSHDDVVVRQPDLRRVLCREYHRLRRDATVMHTNSRPPLTAEP